uniref:Deoxyribonuclease TATDN3 n=1 Tax=Ascaris lumbricoides TaxID=6252 RepID=A0A0M3HXP0_ASCLU
MLLFQVEVIKLRHPMIDCHCHLADEQFADDIDEVVDRARRAGVAATLVCSEFSEQFADVINLSKRFPGFCFPCIGIHPIQVGLDFSPRFIKLPDAKDVQVAVFRRQIELAITHDLTLNVHSRSAGRPVIDVLRECGAKRVLMHAFDGNEKNAQPAIEAGYYFSIPPSFSFSERLSIPSAEIRESFSFSQCGYYSYFLASYHGAFLNARPRDPIKNVGSEIRMGTTIT